ncbi:MAG: CatB-related O-acetyltransferase [Bacteroidia bacterium]|nr:CatB-related O-acetyltransferase [Bacteroidia bacterium]
MFYSLLKQTGTTFAEYQNFEEIKPKIVIGNDCWIGDRVYLIGGVNVGDGAVILSGAVVTKDIPPYSIVGGVPARVLKYRYDEETINYLLKVKWWNKPIDWIKNNWELFSDMDKFKDNV